MGTTKKGRGKGEAAEDFSFQVDLKGIIRLLSENLYSSADVFLRELLQNAVDAIEARRAQEPDFTNGKIWIAYHRESDGQAVLIFLIMESDSVVKRFIHFCL